MDFIDKIVLNIWLGELMDKCHPTLGCAVPAIAWTSGVMEWLERGFKDVSLTYLRRLILHEKAHFYMAVLSRPTDKRRVGRARWMV